MRIWNILNSIKYFNIYVAIRSCYKLTNLVLPLTIFSRFSWCVLVCSRDCFLHDMNIQQIVLPADDWHALVNKHGHNLCLWSSLLQSGPQYMLPRATLATPLAAPWLRHTIQSYLTSLDFHDVLQNAALMCARFSKLLWVLCSWTATVSTLSTQRTLRTQRTAN